MTRSTRGIIRNTTSIFTFLAFMMLPGAGEADPVSTCPGDCNSDGVVSINEVITAVNIALQNTTLDRCRAADLNGDSVVTVDELVTEVLAALWECPLPTVTPEPIATNTATPASRPSPSNTNTPTRDSSPTASPTATGTFMATGTPTPCMHIQVSPNLVNYVGICSAEDCFEVHAASDCCWSASGPLDIVSGGSGCGNGTVCYRAYAGGCDHSPGCYVEDVGGARFGICFQVPTRTPPPTATPMP